MSKKITVRHRAEALGARLLVALFRAMPVDLASAVGGWIGRTLGPRLPVHRTAERNLARAMPELNADERRRALRGMWDNFGRCATEYPHLDAFRPYQPDGRVEVIGIEYLDQLRDDGIGALFFSGHFGNLELAPLTLTHRGLRMAHVYRPANNPLTDTLVQQLRGPIGGTYLPKGRRGMRGLVQALSRGEHLAMLIDQKFNEGLPVPFFGRPAMTAPALARLALRFDVPVVPVRVERQAGARFRVTVFPPFRLQATGNDEADALAGMTQANAILEEWIRERPDHWFWVHKRWRD